MASPDVNDSAGSAAGVQHVALQLPPFLADDPETWFIIAEARLANANISASNTKFNRLVGHLSADVINAVKAVVLDPPAVDPYAALKTAILNRFRAPIQLRASRFMDEEPLGGRDVLRYIQEMDDNARGLTLDHLKRIKLLRVLPAAVRNVLVFNDEDDYLRIARLAHAVMTDTSSVVAPVKTDTSTVALTPSQPTPPHDNASTDEVTFAVDVVDQLRHRRRLRQPNRFVDSRTTASGSDLVCYYHRRFGTAARRCEGKCSFHPNAKPGRRM